MPEGPEIKRAADEIARVLVGSAIESLTFGLQPLQPFESLLRGQEVVSVRPRGKAMLIRFENELTLYSHNQLYGLWVTCSRGKPPATKRSLRVALHTSSHSALLYSASEVAVLNPQQLQEHPFLRKLGPDVLDETLSSQHLVRRLRSPAFQRRALASLYLDQGFLAGIGNYLRSEILFAAELTPQARPVDLNDREILRLAKQSLAVSRRAYRHKGVTNSQSRVKRLRSAGSDFESYRFCVFNREGQDCYTCGSPVMRTTLNSRRLYYCPSCQIMLNRG